MGVPKSRGGAPGGSGGTLAGEWAKLKAQRPECLRDLSNPDVRNFLAAMEHSFYSGAAALGKIASESPDTRGTLKRLGLEILVRFGAETGRAN